MAAHVFSRVRFASVLREEREADVCAYAAKGKDIEVTRPSENWREVASFVCGKGDLISIIGSGHPAGKGISEESIFGLRQMMFVERPHASIQNGILAWQVVRIRIQPRVDVVFADRNGASIMSGLHHF
jgi:hypothetical protein